MAKPVQFYYYGGCPICAREIAFYQARPGGDTVIWVDVTAAAARELGPDLTRAAALARMHVRRPDGTLVSGAAAFAELWRTMPGFKWLGRLLSVPPFGAIAEIGYRGFLLIRKTWR